MTGYELITQKVEGPILCIAFSDRLRSLVQQARLLCRCVRNLGRSVKELTNLAGGRLRISMRDALGCVVDRQVVKLDAIYPDINCSVLGKDTGANDKSIAGVNV